MGLVFPVSINEETGSVETRSSQYLGKFGKYYIYDTFLDTEGHAYMGSESGLLSATFKYSEEYGTYGFFGGTAYTINNKTGEFLAMLLQTFKAKSASEANFITTSAGWWRHISCQFQRKNCFSQAAGTGIGSPVGTICQQSCYQAFCMAVIS